MRLSHLGTLAIGPLLLSLMPSTANAEPSRWTVRGRVELGSMLTHDQRTALGIDGVATGASASVSYAVGESLRVEGALTGNYFLSGQASNAGAATLAVGPRIVLPIAHGNLALELGAHLGGAWTGPWILPALDAGAALMFRVSDEVFVGPEFTFTQIVWPDTQGRTTDAQYLLGGIAISYRPSSHEERPTQGQPTQRVVERHTERVEIVTLRPPPLVGPSQEELDRLLNEAVPTGTRNEVYLVPPVLFAVDSALLSDDGEVALHSALELLNEFDGNVIIEGHSDESGALRYNQSLSEERARTVYFWLTERGVDPSRLSMEARGEETPLEGNSNSHERTLNRRVTFRWVRDGDEAQ